MTSILPGSGLPETSPLLNLNGLAAHDFVNMPLIEAFITAQSFDIICFSETFLDSNIDISDTRINLSGYSLQRPDHPSKTKCGEHHYVLKRLAAIDFYY